MIMLKDLAVVLTTLAAAIGGTPDAPARDLLITGAKPDRLFVINPTTRSIQTEFHIPGANNSVATIVPSSDGRIAYVLVNRMESIVGVDLLSGKTVFRADLSQPGERVKDFYAMAVTPDGKELIAYELRTLLKLSEYQVEEPRFAIFRTDGGLKAKAVRQFAAPRRVHMLLMRPAGKSFYALGFDLYEYDVKSGKLLGTRGIQNWDLPGHSQPDLLAFWPVTEPTGVFSSPLYSEEQANGNGVLKTALMSLDLASGVLDYHDFEQMSGLIVTTVLSPDRKTAYGVFTTLSRIDVQNHTLAQRVPLDHAFYSINLSSDGKEIYLGGTLCDVGFYDAASLEKKAVLKLPGCPDQASASLRVIHTR
jgi:quinohemoprotein amine dehydrogenase beta subunit